MESSSLERQLREIVFGDSWIMNILRAVREVDIPEGYVGAGAIRSLVWNTLHGYSRMSHSREVDVVYFDSERLGRTVDEQYERKLHSMLSELQWDVTNQAGVHLWYEAKYGVPADPLISVEDGLATWPETATAVAIRLKEDATLDVLAPFGLEDLFAMIVRRNPRRVPLDVYHQRIEQKAFQMFWPNVQILYE